MSIRFSSFSNGQCEFLALFKNLTTLVPNTTSDLPPFYSTFMIKLFLDLKEGYFTRINVFFPEDFMRLLFDVALNSDNTRRFLCNLVIQGPPCAAILNYTATATENCTTALAALPSTEGTLHCIDGKTQGCRDLHGVLALLDPKLHCAHVSFAPLMDSHGQIKCQTSKQVLPSDLFTTSDFRAYRTFSWLHGIDPAKGHDSKY